MKQAHLLLGISGLSVLVVISCFEYRAITQLRKANGDLEKQIERLKLDDANIKQNVSPSADKAAMTNDSLGLLKLRGELSTLRGQSAEELRVKAENDKLRAIWMEKLLAREKMSLKQVEPFLASKQRSAESLLAAFRLTGDKTLLREALEKHPADPQVNYAAYQAFKQELPPDERLQRLEAFKQADPGNSMANYLSAREYFNAGQKERAIEELTAASGKQNMQDYSASYVQNAEEAFLSVGFSSLEAKTLSLTVLEYPQLSEMKALGRNLTDMAKTYGKAGDETSALNASQMAIALGRRVSEPSALSSMIQDLVGAAIERSALDGMNPSAIYDNTGRTVKMRLDELAQHRAAIGGLAGNDLVAYMKSLPEQDQFGYFEKLKISGEFAALNWLKNKQTKP